MRRTRFLVVAGGVRVVHDRRLAKDDAQPYAFRIGPLDKAKEDEPPGRDWRRFFS